MFLSIFFISLHTIKMISYNKGAGENEIAGDEPTCLCVIKPLSLCKYNQVSSDWKCRPSFNGIHLL